LAVHAAALAVLLVSLLPIIGTSGQFSADEGAAIAQARQLVRGDGWTVPDSFPAADPDGSAFPFELSNRGGDRYAPFAKHPVYPLMLAAADRVLGGAGMFLWSIGGTVAAALLAALLARRLDPALGVPAFWVTGIASPLLFDSYTVIAHSIGAALAGLAVLCAVKALERPARRWSLIIVVTVAAATMLRTEMLFFALGLSIALVMTNWKRTVPWLLSAAPVAGAALGSVLDRLLLKVVVPGPQSMTEWLESPSSSFIGARVSAFKISWLLPSYDVDLGGSLLVAAIASGAIATWLARARPSERDGIRLFAFVAAVAAVAWLFLGDGPVPGLLSALPIVVIGVVAWDRRPLPAVSGLLAVTFVLFTVGVLATQYASGGSGEWGGRYFAIGIPLLVPVVLLPAVRIWRTLDRPTAILGTSAFIVLSLALSVTAVETLRQYHHDVDAVVAAIDVAARAQPALDGGTQVVLTTNGGAARFAYTVVERTRWLTVPTDRLEEYARRVRGLGVGPITLVTTDRTDLGRVQDVYRETAEVQPSPGWIVATLQPR
jgi:hypothetical protein